MNSQNFFMACFGCKLNQYHAMLLRQNLISAGYVETLSLDEAQILIISSCVVTQKAEQEVFALVRKSKKAGKDIYAVGCFGHGGSSRLREEGVFFGTEEEVFKFLNENSQLIFSTMLFDLAKKSRAFVKIQEGCNQFCSYCIVPYTRGRSRSKSKDEVLMEIKAMTQHGVKEIVLTGTQIGLYQADADASHNLSDLLKSIDELFSGVLYRARLSSIHPNYVNEELVEALAQSKLWCNHLHLSLQSGSDKILQSMNRKYTSDQYLKKIQMAKTYLPEVLFTTDIIVGFPGEEEEDFQQSCALAKEVHFSKIHVFPYSPRIESASYKFAKAVPSLEIQSRKKYLLELSKNLSYNLNCTFMGKTVEVLIERDFTGYTRNYKKVCLLKDPARDPHTLLQVVVSRCNEDLLFE